MTGTCKTCKWWKPENNHPAAVCGTCDRVNAYAQPGPLFTLYVQADDDSGLEAELETGSDFGCIHQQERA